MLLRATGFRLHTNRAVGTRTLALSLLAAASVTHCARGTVTRHDGGSLGASVVSEYQCDMCHTSSNPADGVLSGQTTPQLGTMAYGANLTPDPDTGIGTWSDDEIIRAVREGIDDQGETLCVMPKFTEMTDEEAQALVAYLRSLPAVHHEIPETVCETDSGVAEDSGLERHDGSATDATATDTGPADTGTMPDVVTPDATVMDTGVVDTGPPDTGVVDTGVVDTGPPDTGVVDTGPADTGGPCTPVLTINEVQTAGPGGASDEFVEIYNDADCEAPLMGYFLAYSSATGTTWSTKWTAADTDVVPPRGYVIIAGAAFSAAPVIGRFNGTTGTLAATGGGIALVDGTLLILDSVGYGSSANNMFVENSPAAAPASGSSIARHPDGADTDDNSADLTAGPSTPGTGN